MDRNENVRSYKIKFVSTRVRKYDASWNGCFTFTSCKIAFFNTEYTFSSQRIYVNCTEKYINVKFKGQI